ncbi:hypothetical protein BDW68DRAFT_195226 [Aspergillus falconensis]
MKVKNRSVCENCRSRKLGCDGKNPECSQCLITGRQCPGYPVNWSFVHTRLEPAQGRRSSSIVHNQARAPPDIPQNAPYLENSLSDISNEVYPHQSRGVHDTHYAKQVDLIVRSYVPDGELHTHSILSYEPRPRICGSWVDVLPDLIDGTGNGVVLAALDALAASIASQRPADAVPGANGGLSYLKAIQTIRKELSAANNFLDRELLASIMCLSLAELMFVGSPDGLTMHTNAVARLLQLNGPERYQTGILHKLFIGFRPLLMIKAIQDRTPSFLALEEWKRTPFAIFTPSPMQSLLSQTASLPSLLLRMDKLFAPRDTFLDEHEAVCLFDCFNDTLRSLNEWEASLSNHAARPLYWYQDQPTGASKVSASRVPCIWFSSITMANALTYIWSFRIICLHEMELLACGLPHLSLGQSSASGEHGIESVPHIAQNLMSQISQSMEYLLQEEMKLFGPASAVLPLQTAYVVATMDANRHHTELQVLKDVIGRLVRKGLQSFPSIILEQNPFLHRWDTLSNQYSAETYDCCFT